MRYLGRHGNHTRDRRGSLRGAAATAAILLFLAGCQSTGGGIGHETPPEHLFAVGLKTLTERYIEPINLRTISVAGLSRLSEIDSEISISDSGGWVVLRSRGARIKVWATPAADNAHGWAKLIDGVIHSARRASTTLATRKTANLSDAVFRGIMSKLDRYSRYASPAAATRNRAMREGFGGLGITLSYDDGLAQVERVLPETPASRAGLRAKDVITHVDGQSLAGLRPSQIVARLRGRIDDPVSLNIRRPNRDRRLTLVVVRARIVPPTVTARLRNGIVTLRISGFNEATADSVEQELRAAQRRTRRRLRGIVLDLRDNPGGLLQEAVAVADLFLDDGPVISTRGRHPRSHQKFDSGPGQITGDLPVAVLINGKSASAAEIVAVALRDRHRAVLLGSSSFGKGSVQTIISLPNRGEMTVTWARMLSPSGTPLHLNGVVPVICTRGADREVNALLSALRRHDEPTARSRVRALYPGRGHSLSVERARAACPPEKGGNNSEVEIARLLLQEGRLYRRVLSSLGPSVAAHPGN